MIKTKWLIPLLVIFHCLAAASQGTRLYDTQFAERIALKDCIDQLEKQFDLEFSYPSEISQQEISPKAIQSTPSLETYLNDLFLSIGFEYQIIDGEKILLRPRAEELPSLSKSWTWQGKLYDQISGEPIMYGLIQTEDQKAFTFTDENGGFKLPLTPQHSDAKIIVHALGYTDQFFYTSQGTLPAMIKLAPTDLLLSEVTILESKPSTLLSGSQLEQRGFQSNQSRTVAGIYNQDIFREMQVVIPGITAHDDGNAGIQIRGSNDNETLIVLDEIPIYRADHFYGIFSGINSDYIEEYAVYKNANPIEYGGKMSGMVDMQTGKAGEKISGTLNVDLLSIDANAKIPFGEKVGLNVAGRSSYTELTKNKSMGLVEQSSTIGSNGSSRNSNLLSQPNFNYWDSNAQLYFADTKLALEVNFYNSMDHYLNQYNNEFTFGPNAQFTKGVELFEHDIQWQNIGGSFLAEYNFGDLRLKAVAYSTHYETTNLINSNLELRQATLDRIARFGLDSKNDIQDYGQKLQAAYDFSKSTLNFGLEFIQHQTSLGIQSNDVLVLNQQIDGLELTTFAAWNWQPTTDWQIELGNRLTQFQNKKTLLDDPKPEYYFLPQMQLKYLAGKQGMLKGSLSRKAQFVREINFQDRLGQSTQYLILSNQKALPIGISWNYMLGGALYFSKLTIDAELYIKNTEGVLAFSNRSIGINSDNLTPTVNNDFKIFRGEGQVMGVDLALQYSDGNYNSSLAYTLSKSTNQFAKIYQNKSFAAPLDSRHQFKWLNQYEWKNFGFFATYVFASGRPYSDISSLAMEALISDVDPESLIKRLPNYHRFDVGVDYTFPIGPTKATIGLSCFNLTNHKNVKYQQYIYSLPNGNQQEKNEVVGAQSLQLDRTFNLNFSIQF